MSRAAFADHADLWSLMVHSVEDQLAQLPLLAPFAAELKAALGEAQERKVQLQRLKGELAQEAYHLQQALARGRSAESRLRAALRASYGLTSEQLIRHGVRPRRKARKSRDGAETPTEPPELAADGAEP